MSNTEYRILNVEIRRREEEILNIIISNNINECCFMYFGFKLHYSKFGVQYSIFRALVGYRAKCRISNAECRISKFRGWTGTGLLRTGPARGGEGSKENKRQQSFRPAGVYWAAADRACRRENAGRFLFVSSAPVASGAS